MKIVRTVVVTGHASGIGAAISQRLAADGWPVIGIDRLKIDAPHLERQLTVDLADTAAVTSLAAELAGTSALVHAAGLMRTAALVTAEASDGDLMWAIHVRALAVLIAGLTPRMPAGGRIVAIGSRTSRGAAEKAYYAASKAAVVGLVRSAAAELVGRGITANVVSPAATATPMLTDGDRTVAPKLPPIGRFIEPSEIAALVAFLLGEEAAAITGQDFLICGGASL